MSQESDPDSEGKALAKASTSRVDEEEKVEALLEQVPNLIRDTLIAVIRERDTPRPIIDPDTFKLAAQTTQQEQDNKLAFLIKKLGFEDEQRRREHDLEVERHKLNVEQSRSVRTMCWPILFAVIFLVLGCIAVGIYLAARDKDTETLGFSILSATVAALFAYLGGLGTPRFWKRQ